MFARPAGHSVCYYATVLIALLLPVCAYSQVHLMSEKYPGAAQSDTAGGCFRPYSPGGTANRLSYGRTVSDDGRYVVFQSRFDALDPLDRNGNMDVYRMDRNTGEVELVSVNHAGTDSGNEVSGDWRHSSQGGNGDCQNAMISADGRYVAFHSMASDLVATDTNGRADVFRRDMQTGTTELVSVTPGGDSGSGYSYRPYLTPDGRHVTFISTSSDLVNPAIGGSVAQVWIRDMTLGTTALASQDNVGTPGDGSSDEAVSSDDGRYVAFVTSSNNLVTEDPDTNDDIYFRDVTGGTISLVTLDTAQTGSGDSGTQRQISISGDGRYVAFTSRSTNLVTTDTNAREDIFIWDRDGAGNRIRLVSLNSAGTDTGNAGSDESMISRDGSRVVFRSAASDLDSRDADGSSDVLARDVSDLGNATPTYHLVSVTPGDAGAAGGSDNAVISSNGRFIAFESSGFNIASPDTDSQRDIFIWDHDAPIASRVTLASQNSDATASGNREAINPSISGDGGAVAFWSESSDFVANDLNEYSAQSGIDVFVFESGAVSAVSTRDPGVADRSGNRGSWVVTNGNPDYPRARQISTDGRFAVFISHATDLVPGTPDTNVDRIYRRDLQTGVTEIVSADENGAIPASGTSSEPSISRDGNRIAFRSSSVLISGISGTQIFARDMTTGDLFHISADTGGSSGGGTHNDIVISGDGNHVLFFSTGTDLHALDTNNDNDVFVRDIAGGVTDLISINYDLTDDGDAASDGPGSISDDGRYVAFESDADNLIDPALGITTNSSSQIYRHDRNAVSDPNILVSIRHDGTAYGDNFSSRPAMNGDGTVIAYQSRARDLIASPALTDSISDVFAWVAGTNEMVSLNPAGTDNGTYSAQEVSVSHNGRYVLFVSGSGDLSGETDNNGSSMNTLIRDLDTNTTELGDWNSANTGSSGSHARYGSISDDGRRIVFMAQGDDLVPGDTNTEQDIIIRDLDSDTNILVSESVQGLPAGTEPQFHGHSNNFDNLPWISGDGSTAIFQGRPRNLSTGDLNDRYDAYAYGGCSLALPITADKWTMVSLPCKPNSTVESVFGDDFGAAQYLSTWVVFERDEVNDKYVQLTLSSEIEQGPSYWILSTVGGTFNSHGTATPRTCPESSEFASVGCFEIDLIGHASGRQNMVGHPFVFNTGWDNVRVWDGTTEHTPTDAETAGLISKTFHKRNLAGNGYDAYDDDDGLPMFGTLNPFDGIWVRAYQDVSLRISGDPAAVAPDMESAPLAPLASLDPAANNGRGGGPKPPPNDENWWVQLSVSSGDLADARNYLGQHTDSEAGPDAHDLGELPPFGSPYLTLLFPHPEWEGELDNYVSDFHALTPGLADRWEFEVHTDVDGLPVSLTWSGPQDILDRSKLTDLATGESLNPGKTAEYLLELNNGVHRFAWELKGKRGSK